MEDRRCKQCENIFKFRACPSDIRSGRGSFCSPSCKSDARIKQPRFNTCLICGSTKPNTDGHIRQFCSRKCRYKSQEGKPPHNTGIKSSPTTRLKQSLKKLEYYANGGTVWNSGLPPEEQPCWRGGISRLTGAYVKRRMDRIKKNGGKHSRLEWETLKVIYNFTCLSCLRAEPNITLTKDHVKPVIAGGSNHISNIQPLCERCNKLKSTKEIDYRVNAERRLRELCSTPDSQIRPVLEPKGRYIVGYQWKDKDMLF